MEWVLDVFLIVAYGIIYFKPPVFLIKENIPSPLQELRQIDVKKKMKFWKRSKKEKEKPNPQEIKNTFQEDSKTTFGTAT